MMTLSAKGPEARYVIVASIDGSSALVRTVLGESKAIHHSSPLAVITINSNNSPLNPGLAVGMDLVPEVT